MLFPIDHAGSRFARIRRNKWRLPHILNIRDFMVVWRLLYDVISPSNNISPHEFYPRRLSAWTRMLPLQCLLLTFRAYIPPTTSPFSLCILMWRLILPMRLLFHYRYLRLLYDSGYMLNVMWRVLARNRHLHPVANTMPFSVTRRSALLTVIALSDSCRGCSVVLPSTTPYQLLIVYVLSSLLWLLRMSLQRTLPANILIQWK